METSAHIGGFTEETASSLSGISVSQLRAWGRQGFFVPSLSNARGIAYGRIYSFTDIAALRVLHTLRNESRCPLPHLAEVGRKLSEMGNEKWVSRRLGVLGRRVHIIDSASGDGEDILDGQLAMNIALEEVVNQLAEDVAAIRKRRDDTVGRISRNKHVMGNAPVVSGTRIPVSTIMQWVERGYSNAAIIEQYPDLSEADIEAAIDFHRSAQAA